MSDGIYLDPSELQEVDAMIKEMKKNLSPEHMKNMYAQIGQYMKRETQRNFERESDPGGTPWKRLSNTTLERRREGPKKSNSHKTLRDTGALAQSIGYRTTPDSVTIGVINNLGTVLKYAKAHQYGIPANMIKRVEVVRRKPRKDGKPNKRWMMNVPWGPIPARPFVGVSRIDLDRIFTIVERYVMHHGSGGDI